MRVISDQNYMRVISDQNYMRVISRGKHTLTCFGFVDDLLRDHSHSLQIIGLDEVDRGFAKVKQALVILLNIAINA